MNGMPVMEFILNHPLRNRCDCVIYPDGQVEPTLTVLMSNGDYVRIFSTISNKPICENVQNAPNLQTFAILSGLVVVTYDKVWAPYKPTIMQKDSLSEMVDAKIVKDDLLSNMMHQAENRENRIYSFPNTLLSSMKFVCVNALPKTGGIDTVYGLLVYDEFEEVNSIKFYTYSRDTRTPTFITEIDVPCYEEE